MRYARTGRPGRRLPFRMAVCRELRGHGQGPGSGAGSVVPEAGPRRVPLRLSWVRMTAKVVAGGRPSGLRNVLAGRYWRAPLLSIWAWTASQAALHCAGAQREGPQLPVSP